MFSEKLSPRELGWNFPACWTTAPLANRSALPACAADTKVDFRAMAIESFELWSHLRQGLMTNQVTCFTGILLERGLPHSIDVIEDDSDDTESEFYDEDTQDEAVVYRLSASGIKLDFIDRVKKYVAFHHALSYVDARINVIIAHVSKRCETHTLREKRASLPQPLPLQNHSNKPTSHVDHSAISKWHSTSHNLQTTTKT